jgi:hypothetical protein
MVKNGEIAVREEFLAESNRRIVLNGAKS